MPNFGSVTTALGSAAMGLQIQILNATTTGEIDAAFATLAREHLDALFVAPDAFFNSRGVQFATLTARERIPAAYSAREIVAAVGLMSYGADLADMSRQVGVYTGSILKGAKPSLIKAGLLSSCTSGWVNARLICLNADEVVVGVGCLINSAPFAAFLQSSIELKFPT